MYKYYHYIGLFPIKKNEKGKYIHNKKFNNIPYFIKYRLYVDCLQDGFVMYNDKVISHKRELITHITNSTIPVDFFQKNPSIINLTTDDMTYKFNCFQRKNE